MSPSPATVYPGVLTQDAINKLLGGPLVPLFASGAIDPHTAQRYAITKAGVAALTLAAPTAGADDGLVILLVSTTAFAHTLTATGLLNVGTASVNLATFAAFAGAGLTLFAYNGLWYLDSANAITFS
jgi:hypothetical protein